MNEEFYHTIVSKPRYKQIVPTNEFIADWALKLIRLLFPECAEHVPCAVSDVRKKASDLQNELSSMIVACSNEDSIDATELAHQFFEQVPEMYDTLTTDIQAIYDGDPAATNEFEVIRTYPGFYAISFYRIAHILHNLNVAFMPRILTEHAHSKTGIDIHPAAIISDYFHIDHGTGIVIGESCVIGRYVKLYQGVTLGALSVHKNMAGTKRHPTVGDRVIIYSGATILGGDTHIGHDSVIGGNVWLTKSVEPYSTVYHTPMITIQNFKKQNNV